MDHLTTYKFKIRLRVRVSKSFRTQETSLQISVAGKDVTLTGQEKDQPLSEAKWLVLSAGNFSSEEEARSFGERLRWMVELAALSSRLGVDIGTDQPTSFISEEFARATGLIKEDERIAPNVHGLMVLPDDNKTRFGIVNITGIVTADPEQFTSALGEAGENAEGFRVAANGVRLLNLALMTSEPLAQMVLAFSAVEELGQNERWSDAQKALIEQTAAAVENSTEGSVEERAEVARSIRRGLHKLGLREGVMRLLFRLDLSSFKREWDRLYAIRSGLFHGTSRLQTEEINQASMDTITLCVRIILAVAAAEGVRIPSLAEMHFKGIIGVSPSPQSPA